MPRTVQLVTYIVRVRERRAKEGFDLTKWPDEGGFCPVIEDCLAGINRNPIKYTASLKVFTYSSCEQDENIIFGQLGAGEYGRRAPIKNVEDGEVEHQMERDHSQEYRFYFQLRVLPENDFAILALQKIGRRGVKTILYDRLQSYFQINYPDYIVDMHPLAPRGYLRHILSNGIREIRFIKRSSTGDEFDRMYDGGWSGGLGKRKVSLEAPIGESIPMPPFLRRFLDGQVDRAEMLEIARIEEFDQLKVEVRLGSSSTRVIDLTNPTTLQARIDVTDEVEWDGDRPTFESLHEVATDLVRDIAEDQGVPR